MMLSYNAIFCEISVICFVPNIRSLLHYVPFHIPWNIHMHKMIVGLVVAQLVKVWYYKPGGYGFNSQWGN